MWITSSASKYHIRKLAKSTVSIEQVLESIKIIIGPFVTFCSMREMSIKSLELNKCVSMLIIVIIA